MTSGHKIRKADEPFSMYITRLRPPALADVVGRSMFEIERIRMKAIHRFIVTGPRVVAKLYSVGPQR